MQGLLSQLPGWRLDHREQDIRGWPLRDPRGNLLGIVRELVADTGSERVQEIVLRDGRRFAAHDIHIGDHALTLRLEDDEALRRRAVPAAAVTVASAKAAVAKRKVARAAERPKEPVKAMVAEKPLRAMKLDGDDRLVSLIDEEMDLGKRQLDAGGVRVETHTVAKPFRQDVSLHEERIALDRRRVDRPLSATDAAALLHDDAIEMSAKSEAAVVDKFTRVVEEIVLTRDVEEHIERVCDSVRHTEVEVTELPGAKLADQKGRMA